MFCPKCRFEYRPEISFCPDCNERLVAELSDDDTSTGKMEYIELETVFETTDHSTIILAKAILDEAGIHNVMPHDMRGSYHGRPFINPLGANQFLYLQVRKEEAPQAKDLLKDLLSP
ncbi:hypothetical protein GF356_09720 [candidate division GN15 bacterium]|nr:hypothetical protein [candidate division GN15 bacterium]